MVIRLTTVKSLLWFLAILLLALSFPLQVYANSPYSSLLPYLLIGLIILLTLSYPRKVIPVEINFVRNNNINLTIGIYVSLLLLTTTLQTVFGVISLYEGVSALVIYLLPVVFYWYFRRIASEQEIRWALLAMIAAAFIVGVYFAYDSYLKLALGQMSDYAREAFQYSLDRTGLTQEKVNDARISGGSRSFGLLETHSVSGAWVILGAFAALALLPRNRRIFRHTIIFVFGTMLLLGLNFTSIIAFSVIIFLFEFGGLSALHGQPLAIIRNLAPLALIAVLLAGVTLWIVGDVMSGHILRASAYQINLLLGTGDMNISWSGLIVGKTEDYFQHIANFPFVLLLGDGFSSFGYTKGGDIGFIESLAKFGLPFFLVIVFGLLSLIKSGLRQIKSASSGQAAKETGLDHGSILQFAICVTLLILITEGHYTVWMAKSILPIVFFALALYDRYLTAPQRRPLPQKTHGVLSVPPHRHETGGSPGKTFIAELTPEWKSSSGK